MALAFDHATNLVEVPQGQVTLDVQALLNEIRAEEATELGITYPAIAAASGKESLGGAVAVGITVELLDSWQVHFYPDNYIAKISGGNLVGGIAGDPVAYSAGVQVLLIQSAASTVVSVGGSALTTEEHDALMALPSATNVAETVWSHDDAAELTGITGGRWRIDADLGVMIFYGKDNVTEIARFELKDAAGNVSVESPFERVRQ